MKIRLIGLGNFLNYHNRVPTFLPLHKLVSSKTKESCSQEQLNTINHPSIPSYFRVYNDINSCLTLSMGINGIARAIGLGRDAAAQREKMRT